MSSCCDADALSTVKLGSVVGGGSAIGGSSPRMRLLRRVNGGSAITDEVSRREVVM